VPLHIIGDGPLTADVSAFIKNHPEQKVIFHGRMEGDQKIRLLSNASALVFPSECYENCPYIILESLAVGTPILASRTGGIPELVSEDKTGVFFAPGNSDAMANCMLRFFEAKDEWLTLRQNARDEALRRFNKKEGLERLEHLFAIVTRRPL